MSLSLLPPVLAELVAYFESLSTLRRDEAGTVTLHTPGVNVLALNATFLPDVELARLRAVSEWHHAHEMPAVAASVLTSSGEGSSQSPPGLDVGTVRVGDFFPVADPGVIVVEQVSRLALPTWAAVLAGAYGTPEWAVPLARHLALRLEGNRDFALLMAYAGGEAVGALLWRAAERGGAAHLWGTLDPAADAPLLTAAYELGGTLRCSLPDSSPLTVAREATVQFTLLDEKGGWGGG